MNIADVLCSKVIKLAVADKRQNFYFATQRCHRHPPEVCYLTETTLYFDSTQCQNQSVTKNFWQNNFFQSCIKILHN